MFDPTSGSDSNSPYAHAMKDPLVEGVRALSLETPAATGASRRAPSSGTAARERAATDLVFEKGRAMREVWGGVPGRRKALEVTAEDRAMATLLAIGEIFSFIYPK